MFGMTMTNSSYKEIIPDKLLTDLINYTGYYFDSFKIIFKIFIHLILTNKIDILLQVNLENSILRNREYPYYFGIILINYLDSFISIYKSNTTLMYAIFKNSKVIKYLVELCRILKIKNQTIDKLQKFYNKIINDILSKYQKINKNITLASFDTKKFIDNTATINDYECIAKELDCIIKGITKDNC